MKNYTCEDCVNADFRARENVTTCAEKADYYARRDMPACGSFSRRWIPNPDYINRKAKFPEQIEGQVMMF